MSDMSDLPNIFANNPLNRATYHRSRKDWISAASQAGLILPLWRGQVFIPTGAKALGLLRAGLIKPDPLIGMIFLGLDQSEKPYFACPLLDVSQPEEEGPLAGLGAFLDVRTLALEQALSPDDLAIAAQARALIEWHRNHVFCPRCGQKTEPIDAGHKRICASCEKEHFPRTDPVVIMMIHHGDKGFLARQKNWPSGFYSALAGFIEPGESIEEAVIRESWEEAQIEIGKVDYHSAQPWPWPYSLMIGCLAEAKHERFKIDGIELDEGQWFSLDEMKQMIARSPSASDQMIQIPPPMAIAHRLISAFVKKL